MKMKQFISGTLWLLALTIVTAAEILLAVGVVHETWNGLVHPLGAETMPWGVAGVAVVFLALTSIFFGNRLIAKKGENDTDRSDIMVNHLVVIVELAFLFGISKVLSL